jgi:hypothetical protein
VPVTIAISPPLSSEYAIVTTGWDEHVEASALRGKGEDTSVLLPGLLTVTPAIAGIVIVASREEMKESFVNKCIK